MVQDWLLTKNKIMSAKRFDELREHVLSLAHIGASPNELTELNRCMRQLEITGKSNLMVVMGQPVSVSSNEDFSAHHSALIRSIQRGDEAGLSQVLHHLHEIHVEE